MVKRDSNGMSYVYDDGIYVVWLEKDARCKILYKFNKLYRIPGLTSIDLRQYLSDK